MQTQQQLEDAVARLVEIRSEIANLAHEAYNLIPRGETIIRGRAKNYWFASLLTALDNESDFTGGPMNTLRDTIEDLDALANEGDDEDDTDGYDPEACPSCGRCPGEPANTCEDPDGCGAWLMAD
jgi:hypothetical protein